MLIKKRRRRTGSRILTVLLAATMLVTTLPPAAFAAQTGSSDADCTVFDALGFDTKAPEGYEQDESLADTPYGKTFTAMAEVDELFTFEPYRNSGAKSDSQHRNLYGHNKSLQGSVTGTLNDSIQGEFNLNGTGSYNGPITLQAEGNFSRENQGQKKNIAFINVNFVNVNVDDNDVLKNVDQTKGALVNFDLGVMDPVTGKNDVFYRATQNAKEFDSSMSYQTQNLHDDAPLYLGNHSDMSKKKYTDKATTGEWTWEFKAAYTAQNYIELSTGDFDGDSIDEIAVYIGETDNPRVEIWKLQDQNRDGYLNPGHYEYNEYIGNVDTGKRTWKIAWTYPLDQYGTNIVPNMVSLSAADYDKDGIDDLAISWGYFGDKSANVQPSRATIMMGADNNKMLTRSYSFDLKSGGTDIYRASFTAGDVDNDGYNELVMGGSLANSDRNSRYLAIYEWNGNGFSIVTEQNFKLFEEENGVRKWQNIKNENKYFSMLFAPANVAVGKFYGIGESPCIYLDSIIIEYGSGGFDILDLLSNDVSQYYVEWGARSADLTGNGTDILLTQSNAVANIESANNLIDILRLTWSDYYKNEYALSGFSFSKGDSYFADRILTKKSTYFADNNNVRNFASLSFSLPNTDQDTTILKYTGEHYYNYSDPEVLAVLASPPYYADLANDDDDSQMIESSTAYSSTKGSGGGSTYSNSFSVGVYTSWEKTWSMLGVELASAEAEASINNTFTWETQKTSSLEYEVEYATMAGVDTVVMYSMPVETYVYEAQIPNKNGDGYDTQTMTVNIPYEPSIQTISLENYNKIYNTYNGVLPDVSNALTHTVGEPGSYAPSVSSLPGDRSQTLAYNGNPFTIGQGSQNTQTQSISMTSEEENSFNYQLDVETKAGAGMGGVKVGVTAGYSHGAGSVHITTSGSSYTATMNGLPTQAEQYGYGFNWKLVGFLYQGKYPVVTYLVTNVKEPPLLPENFGANEEETTTDQIALEWDYSGNAAGFVIYRYFQSPSASGYYKIGTVEAGEGSASGSGRHYTYTDTGLSPNTGYQYRIQTIGTSVPNTSIPSEAYTTYTKPESGVPQIAVSSEALAACPDTVVWTAVNITNQSELTGARFYYQWQKQSDRGGWEDVDGEKDQTLTFRYPNAGVEGVYRCKISALADQNLVTAYSPEVTVTYTQREAVITDLTIDKKAGSITATVKGKDVTTIPAGTVSFNLGSGSARSVYTAKLDATGTATVKINPANGVYKVTADYSGSKVFLPASYEPDTPEFYAKGVKAAQYYVDVKDTYTYGDEFDFVQYTVDADGNIVNSQKYNPGESNNWTFPNGSAIKKMIDSKDRSYDTFIATIKTRFCDGRAGWVGPVTLRYLLTENSQWSDIGGYRSVTFNIEPKDAKITGLEDVTKSITDVQGLDNTTELLVHELYDKLDFVGYVNWKDGETSTTPFGARLQLVDTAGKAINSFSETGITAPGVYTIAIDHTASGIEFGVYDHNFGPANYNFTAPTAKLTVTGATYNVSATVAEGQSAYGSVSVSSPAGASQAAVCQTVIFRAVPNNGYEVAGWTLNGKEVENSTGQDTLTRTQTTEGLNAVVSFRTKQNTLTVTALPASPTVGGESVTNSVEANTDAYFQNGNAYATGSEITFTPKSADGWHFTGWEYHVSGQYPQYSDEETFTVKMPDDSVQLYAKFERDAYRLDLGEHITAYINGKVITDLAAVTGDTEVTVRPAVGYSLAENAKWIVNGVEQDAADDGSYTFNIISDTNIKADVDAQTYTVTINDAYPENSGTAAATATGSVIGGTEVTFTAAPARGHEFAGWKTSADKEDIVSASASYTVTIGADLTLTPVFKAQTGKTVKLSAGDGGSVDWSIEGIDPDDSDIIIIYPGETLKLTASPTSGRMVAGWNINDLYNGNDYSREKIFAYSELEASNTISVTFKPVTYFTVNFADDISATADGNDVTSGDDVAAGSKMIFSYNGSDGNVTRWKNGETEYPLMKDLIIEALSEDLNITLETGELIFFTVEDISTETDKHYTVNVTGTYEDNDRYAENSSVTVTVKPESGFSITDVSCEAAEFINDEASGIWKADIESITDNISYTVSTEKIIPKYTLTFNTNGGSDIAPVTDKENSVIDISKYVPSKSGYKFNGWFTDSELKAAASSSVTLTGDITLYAGWTSGSSSGGGGGGSSSGGSGSSGGSTTTVTPPSTDPTPGTSDNTIAIGAVTDASGNKLETTAGKDGSVTVKTGSDKDSVIIADIKNASPGTAAYIVKPDGTEELVRDSVVLNGRLYMNIPDGAVIKAADRSTKFSDVDEKSWSADAIAFVSGHGLFNGTSADSFSPSAEMTREMLMTVIARLNGADTSGDALAKGMAWAVENGISDGSNPKGSITREQIAAMLYRNAGEPDVTYDSSHLAKFSDASEISGYAEKAMLWAAEAGIINGTTDNRLLPRANATREQVAQMMLNYVSSLYR